jgi:hypothetical protein
MKKDWASQAAENSVSLQLTTKIVISERSASQIHRVTQRLVARSRRTTTALILLMPLGAFQPLKRLR